MSHLLGALWCGFKPFGIPGAGYSGTVTFGLAGCGCKWFLILMASFFLQPCLDFGGTYGLFVFLQVFASFHGIIPAPLWKPSYYISFEYISYSSHFRGKESIKIRFQKRWQFFFCTQHGGGLLRSGFRRPINFMTYIYIYIHMYIYIYIYIYTRPYI